MDLFKGLKTVGGVENLCHKHPDVSLSLDSWVGGGEEIPTENLYLWISYLWIQISSTCVVWERLHVEKWR
jgi:hypothetical protein